MFHQFIFIILLSGALLLNVLADLKIYYHLFYKHDYQEWSDNGYQDIRAIIGERKFKLMITAIFGISAFCIFTFSFSLYRLSFSFENPWLTHIALTSLLLTILGQGSSLCTFPLPGITNVKLSKPRIIMDFIISLLNYLCLFGMIIQIIL